MKSVVVRIIYVSKLTWRVASIEPSCAALAACCGIGLINGMHINEEWAD